jgi:hypothetical protein
MPARSPRPMLVYSPEMHSPATKPRARSQAVFLRKSRRPVLPQVLATPPDSRSDSLEPSPEVLLFLTNLPEQALKNSRPFHQHSARSLLACPCSIRRTATAAPSTANIRSRRPAARPPQSEDIFPRRRSSVRHRPQEDNQDRANSMRCWDRYSNYAAAALVQGHSIREMKDH